MNTPAQIASRLSAVFEERQAVVLSEVIYEAYSDLVKSGEFNELKSVVHDLAVETRHLSGETQRLSGETQRLAEAQQRTEQRVEELVVAQQRTEQRVEELAVAQQRTEHALQGLARQVGGLSDRFGGDLEDAAYIVIHDALERELGWKVDVLARTWQQWNGREEEIDIFGRAHDPARPAVAIWVMGEVKFNLTIRDVERFIKKVARAQQALDDEVYPVCFCYRARPEVQKAVTDAGFRLVFSYGRLV